MKKFQFQLNKILNYKGQVLESEMMRLAVLNNQLHNVRQKLQNLVNEQEQSKKDFESKIREKTTPAACQMYLQYKEYIKGQIKLSEAEADRFTTQINEQMEVIKKIMVETKTLDTLKAYRQDAYNMEIMKCHELQIEEFVTASKLMSNVI